MRMNDGAPARAKGKWLEVLVTSERDKLPSCRTLCSRCGFMRFDFDARKYNYCPSCGSVMEEDYE